MTSLDKVRWCGKNLKVSFSRHNHIQMPKEGQSVSTGQLFRVMIVTLANISSLENGVCSDFQNNVFPAVVMSVVCRYTCHLLPAEIALFSALVRLL